MAKRTYKAYRDMLDSDRWRRLANEGASSRRAPMRSWHRGTS
jgi:hypothetical protein